MNNTPHFTTTSQSIDARGDNQNTRKSAIESNAGLNGQSSNVNSFEGGTNGTRGSEPRLAADANKRNWSDKVRFFNDLFQISHLIHYLFELPVFRARSWRSIAR